MRVFGWQTQMRNESESKVRSSYGGAASTDLDALLIDLSKSISVRTRKMVNYAWVG